MDPIHGLAGALSALVIWVLLSSVVAGKDPYLDFTCVASQALSSNTSQFLIEVYTPLGDAAVKINKKHSISTQTNDVGPQVCSLEKENLEATTTVILSSADANLYPPRLTVTFDPNEEINLEMLLRHMPTCTASCRYRWSKVGDNADRLQSKEKLFRINGLSKTSIVFGNFFVGAKDKRGFVQVLVRECPSGYWNPEENCALECSNCLNGGMCHPRSGQCICPPGFSGVECEIVHGRNIFGQEGQYSCSASSDPHDNGCIGKLFCLPEPFGCTCGAGYRGIDCSEGCGDGAYGANCEGVCHCKDNSTCLADTGECAGSSCQDGWLGTNCQVRGPWLYEELNEVNINQTTNVTCILENVKNPNDSDIVLILPNGMTIEAHYFIEYETPVIAEYIFDVFVDARENEYKCTNANMTLEKAFKITAFEPPYLTNPPTINSSKVNEITISWTPWRTQHGDKGDPPVVNYIITYKDANETNATTAVMTQGNTTFYTVVDLIEDTEYEFRVTAVRPGVGGAGPPSPPAHGNTTCRVLGPPKGISTVLENHNLNVTWNVPGCAVRIGKILGYHYQLHSGGKITAEGVTVPVDKQHTFKSLLPCTKYGFHVRGWTSAGNGSFSQIQNVTTPIAVPGKPVNFIGKALNATSLQFSWSQPINTVCSVITYNITYWLKQQGECLVITKKTWDRKLRTTGNHSLVIGDLLPNSTYKVKIVAITSAGKLNDEAPFSYKTSESVPGPPESISTVPENYTLNAKWEAPGCAVRNGKILGYHYQLLISGETIAAEGVTKSTVGQHTFDNLLPCTKYGFRVRGRTSAGNGSFSQIQNVTTLGAVPDEVTDIQVSSNSSTTLHVSWSAPTNPPCPVTNYSVAYTLVQWGQCEELEDVETNTIAVSDTKTALEMLHPDSEYVVVVRAETVTGSGNGVNNTGRTLEDAPGRPVAIRNTTKSSSSVTFTWPPPACRDRNGAITGYIYKLVHTTSRNKLTETSLSPDVTSASFDGLTACTKYHFKVRASTSVGNSSFSDAVYVTTDGEAPDKVSDLQTEPLDTSIHLNWTQPENTSCNITNYKVTYKLIKVLQCLDEENADTQKFSVEPPSTQHTIFGLFPASKYMVSVKAETEGGLGEERIEEVETLQSVPGKPVAINNTLISSRSVTFTWQPPACRERKGAIIGYTYKLVHTTSKNKLAESSVSPEVTSASIDGLTPCTKYHFKVRAHTSVGYSSFSDEVTVTTDGEAPDAIGDFQTKLLATSIHLNWTQPKNTSCDIISYKVTYKLIKVLQCLDEENNNTLEFTVMPPSTQHMIFHLLPASKYIVSVKAETEVGLGEERMEEVITLESVPGRPVAISNTLTSSRSVTFTWQPLACRQRNGTITGYTYKLINTASKDPFTESSVSPDVTSASIDGLTPCTKYHFKVQAHTSVGYSPFSGAVYVTTDGEVPDVVSNVQVSSTSDSIQVTWEPPTKVSCDITNYLISHKLIRYHQCSEIDQKSREHSVMVGNAKRVYTIPELSAASDYLVSVRANTTSGLGDVVSMNVSTPESVPGKPVAINNTFTSSRSVNFTWQPPTCRERNGTITGYTYKLVHTANDDKLTETSMSPNVTSATFHGLTACTEYHFKVRARTSVNYGSFSDAVYVTTDGEVPDVVTNVQVSSTSNSIQVTWEPPTNVSCDITNYLISYKLIRYHQCSEIDQKSREHSVMVGNASRVYTIAELSAASDYLVSVRANTTSGLGDVVNINVSTPESAPESVTNVTLTDVGPFDASFSWSPPVCEDMHGRITLYSYNLVISDTETIAGNTTDEVISFESLLPCTFYGFTVAAWTSAGMGHQSKPLNFTTNVTVPGQVGKPAKKDFKNSTAVRIQWSSPSSTENPCSIKNYTVTYYLQKIKQCLMTSKETFIRITTETELLLVSLRPNSVYIVSVKASTIAGEGVPSMEKKVFTDFDAPGQITDVMVSNTTTDSIQFTWGELDCESQHDQINGYNYEFKVDEVVDRDTDNDDDDDDGEGQTSVLFAVFSDLKSCTEYKFRVQASGENNNGIWSNWVKATSTAVPEKVSNLTLQRGKDPSSIIQVTWQQSDKDDCKINEYQVMYNGESLEVCSPSMVFNSTSITVTTHSATLRNLTPYSKYNVTVRGKTTAGLGKMNTRVHQTAQGIPSAPPEDISLVGRGPNHLNFTWQPPICGQQNGLIDGYTYTLAYNNETVENTTVATEAFLDDLIPFVEYDFTVLANTKKRLWTTWQFDC